mgnify:CR=1 FL=1
MKLIFFICLIIMIVSAERKTETERDSNFHWTPYVVYVITSSFGKIFMEQALSPRPLFHPFDYILNFPPVGIGTLHSRKVTVIWQIMWWFVLAEVNWHACMWNKIKHHIYEEDNIESNKGVIVCRTGLISR